MTYLLEDLVVGILVVASALFSTWRLLSVRLRMRVLDLLEPTLGQILGAPLRQMRSKTLALLAGGCSACAAGRTHLRIVKR
jgi:hypothetical protein